MSDQSFRGVVITQADAEYESTAQIQSGQKLGFTSCYEPYVSYVLIRHERLLDRVRVLAGNILDKISGEITLVCVLKGAFPFTSDLTREIKEIRRNDKTKANVIIKTEFIRVSSYENDSSTGNIKINFIGSSEKEFINKNILIVEDIIDTGKTMVKLVEEIKSLSPRSVHVVSLLLKKSSLSNGYVPDFFGFEIPDAFVIGYGLDYNEYFRDLDDICVINGEGIQKFAI